MEKKNYHQELLKTLEEIKQDSAFRNSRPRLLLHACCAPCSSYVLEFLMKHFDISIYYYNPNIHPAQEYHRRLEELKVFLPKFSQGQNISLVEADYDPEEYFSATNTRVETELQTEAEKGERCRRCYSFRMQKSYDYACRNNFDYFTTTLSISPHKDAEKINVIGANLQGNVKFLAADFKKKNGFKRSLELSEQFGLYRQDYCGCIFSKQNRESNN